MWLLLTVLTESDGLDGPVTELGTVLNEAMTALPGLKIGKSH